MNRLPLLVLFTLVAGSVSAAAQQTDPARLTVRRIYGSPEFAAQPFGPSRWLGDGTAYTTVEPPAQGAGQDIVRYDVERGAREVLVATTQLLPQGASAPLDVENYA